MIDQSLITKYYRVPQNMADDHITAKFYDLLEVLTANGFEVMYGCRDHDAPIIYFTLKNCLFMVFGYDQGQYFVDTCNTKLEIKNIVAKLNIAVKVQSDL